MPRPPESSTWSDEVIFERWYVNENDVIGGWVITNIQAQRLSEVWGYGTVRVYFETPTKELAQYVVALHNYRLGVRD